MKHPASFFGGVTQTQTQPPDSQSQKQGQLGHYFLISGALRARSLIHPSLPHRGHAADVGWHLISPAVCHSERQRPFFWLQFNISITAISHFCFFFKRAVLCDLKEPLSASFSLVRPKKLEYDKHLGTIPIRHRFYMTLYNVPTLQVYWRLSVGEIHKRRTKGELKGFTLFQFLIFSQGPSLT